MNQQGIQHANTPGDVPSTAGDAAPGVVVPLPSATCSLGFGELVRLHEAAEEHVRQLLMYGSRPAKGMEGIPLPYRMSADWPITAVICVSFLLLAYALRNGKKYIFQRMRRLFVHKRRPSLFDTPTGSDTRYTVALTFISCILSGLCLFDYSIEHQAMLVRQLPHALLLGIYCTIMLAYVLLKGGLYSFVNWIFFEKEQQNKWSQTYFDLWSGLCLLLFPVILLAVYLDLPSVQIESFCVGIWCFAKILLFYKCVRNFFSHFYGILHLILYFCALEIIPAFLLWVGIGEINSLLILKF